MDGYLTFSSSTGTTYSNYQRLNTHPGSGTGLQTHHPQTLRVTAEATGDPSSGTNTLRAVIYNTQDGQIRGHFDATITWTTVRTGTDGSSGRYLGTVAWAETGTSLLDLLGNYGKGSNSSSDVSDDFRLGITDSFAGSATAIRVNFAFGGWPIR